MSGDHEHVYERSADGHSYCKLCRTLEVEVLRAKVPKLLAERNGFGKAWERAIREKMLLRAVIEQTAVFEIAGTFGVSGHCWVRHADDDTAKDIVWCQWCGVHRSELPDWKSDPPCEALAAMRALGKKD